MDRLPIRYYLLLLWLDPNCRIESTAVYPEPIVPIEVSEKLITDLQEVYKTFREPPFLHGSISYSPSWVKCFYRERRGEAGSGEWGAGSQGKL